MDEIRALKMTAANDLRGLDWTEDDDFVALRFNYHGSQWTSFVCYVKPNGMFSVYETFPDVDKGIDCEDERLIDSYVTPQAAINAIKRTQVLRGDRCYETALPVNSAPQRAPHYIY